MNKRRFLSILIATPIIGYGIYLVTVDPHLTMAKAATYSWVCAAYALSVALTLVLGRKKPK